MIILINVYLKNERLPWKIDAKIGKIQLNFNANITYYVDFITVLRAYGIMDMEHQTNSNFLRNIQYDKPIDE